MSEKMPISFVLNGRRIQVLSDPTRRLLDVLREDLRLTGTKEGCSIGECGACTVIVNGQACSSCLIMIGQMEGAEILTVEGLAASPLGRQLQESFVDKGAVQCGFCTPGMLMSAFSLLSRTKEPTLAEIKEALSGNLCRCTGYIPIFDAVQDAAEKMNGRMESNEEAREI